MGVVGGLYRAFRHPSVDHVPLPSSLLHREMRRLPCIHVRLSEVMVSRCRAGLSGTLCSLVHKLLPTHSHIVDERSKQMAESDNELRNPGNEFSADVQNARQSKGGEPVSDSGGQSQVPDTPAIKGGMGSGGGGGSGGQGGGSQGGGGQGDVNV